MGVLDFFVEREDKPKEKPKYVPTKQPTILTSPAVESIVPLNNSINATDYLMYKKKFDDILADENKRNYPGTDYFEFTQMKNAMSAIPQEEVRYQAAYAGWSVGGQNKKVLVDTANIYLGLVDREINEFEEAFKVQYAEKVTKNEEDIARKSKEIVDLTDKINKLNAEVVNLKMQNGQNTAALKDKHDAFMAAGSDKRQEILNEIEKINQFIQ
jgi:hypothetical protein